MKSNKGFTLIELLVVIAIIGILSSVVLASLNSARLKSRDARRISDMKQIQLALELYFDANGSKYPVAGAAGTPANLSTVTALAPTYIATVPVDPVNSGDQMYKYFAPVGGATYCLGVVFEGDNSATTSSSATCKDATHLNLNDAAGRAYAIAP